MHHCTSAAAEETSAERIKTANWWAIELARLDSYPDSKHFEKQKKSLREPRKD